tara:strand:+ start:1106 stop:1279 length:174 start_codon:yes stop_codon:yes gene_type:complete
MERNIGDLSIERGETGFVVYENAGMGFSGRKWAFETPTALAEFVASWAAKDEGAKDV